MTTNNGQPLDCGPSRMPSMKDSRVRICSRYQNEQSVITSSKNRYVEWVFEIIIKVIIWPVVATPRILLQSETVKWLYVTTSLESFSRCTYEEGGHFEWYKGTKKQLVISKIHLYQISLQEVNEILCCKVLCSNHTPTNNCRSRTYNLR